MKTSKPPIHVVVGFDFSPLAELALREAAAMTAERPEIAIHLVNARSDHDRHPISHSASQDVGFQVEQEMRESARIALHDHSAGEGVQVFSYAVVGSPARAILETADVVDAELIIVGTHGRRGLKRLVLGSVAEEVMREASCPVLVMRPRRHTPHPELVPEPPCPDCVEVREATGGARWWCEVHDRPWVPAHRYSYQGGDLGPYHPDR